MSRGLAIAAAALVLAMVAAVHARAAAPAEFRAHYSAYAGGLRVAESVVELERDRQHYTYRSITKPVGLLAILRNDEVIEYSILTLHRDGIRPLHYGYLHKRSDKDRDVELEFDWSTNKVANTAEGHTWSMPIPDGTLDKFSVQLAVMMDLAVGTRPPLDYPVADGGKLKHYRFADLGTERVSTPAGEFEAIKLQRLRERDKERETYFWCAPELGYLLVRLEHIDENGQRLHLQLERVEGL